MGFRPVGIKGIGLMTWLRRLNWLPGNRFKLRLLGLERRCDWLRLGHQFQSISAPPSCRGQ